MLPLILHCEWRYVGVRINPRRSKKNQKIIFVSFVNSFFIIFGENKYFGKSHPFACLIKGIVLGWVLWDANTFPTRNRLADPKSVFFSKF